MTPADIAAIEARLSAATPGPWGWVSRGSHDALCAADGAVVHSDGSAAGEYGPDIDVNGPDANLIAHAPTDIAALLAEVRRLTAERATALEAISDAGDYVEGDSLIDSINELITDTDEIRRQGRRENEAGDIVGEIRPMLGGVDQEGVIRAVAEVVDERDALRARVAELEEAARWRPAREAVPSAEPVAITLYVMGIPTRSEGRKTGPNNWKTPHGSRYDADILGWRPLGPGPVAP